EQLKKASGDLAATSRNYALATADLDKVTRHSANLEGELQTLRRNYALAERLLLDLEGDEAIRARLRRKRKAYKYAVNLPKLGAIWSVNLANNLYMEWWQRRKGVTIFPGTQKANGHEDTHAVG
ncbi:hypothetical protein KDL45_11495, partial [bacterium]|nr:hypothetical protein [bacterium]